MHHWKMHHENFLLYIKLSVVMKNTPQATLQCTKSLENLPNKVELFDKHSTTVAINDAESIQKQVRAAFLQHFGSTSSFPWKED